MHHIPLLPPPSADQISSNRAQRRLVSRLDLSMLVGTYVKERDNNRIKGGKTGVIFWSKVYCLSIKDMGEAYILYINGR